MLYVLIVMLTGNISGGREVVTVSLESGQLCQAAKKEVESTGVAVAACVRVR